MKKHLVFTLFMACLLAHGTAHAYTVYCTNCSTMFTQMMDRVTNIEQLSTAIDQYGQAVQQTEQQIRMVQQNIEQYQNMLKNTQSLSPSMLASMSGDFRRLAHLQSQLKLQRGDAQAMQNLYQEMYPAAGSLSGQTGPEFHSRLNQWSNASDQAYQSTFQMSGRQLNDLQNADAFDAKMQELLTTPQGRMEALQSANQLTAMQLQESRELRSLMGSYVQAQMQAAAKAEREEQVRREFSQKVYEGLDELKGLSKTKAMDVPR